MSLSIAFILLVVVKMTLFVVDVSSTKFVVYALGETLPGGVYPVEYRSCW